MSSATGDSADHHDISSKLAVIDVSGGEVSSSSSSRKGPLVELELPREKNLSDAAGLGLSVPDRLKFELPTTSGSNSPAVVGEVKVSPDAGVVTATTAASNDDKFDIFVDWLLENGAEFPSLYLRKYTESVRGVHASKDILPYKPVLAVPHNCLITDKMGRVTELGRKVFGSHSYHLSVPNIIAVVIFMLTDREDENSFFKPYYDTLPSDWRNFPIFWDESELEWLRGSKLVGDIAARKENMRSDYDEVCRIAPEFAKYSFEEDFLPLRTAVGSRNFGIVVDGEKVTAMVPYADMLNHFRPRETSWTFNNARNAFVITSLKTLVSGQQVMDSYGKKCNSKFLLHYGFAIESNREEDGKCQNEVVVRVGLDDDDAGDEALNARKRAFVGASRAFRTFRLSMNHDDRHTADCLSFMRICAATHQEMDVIVGGDSSYRRSSSSVGFLNPRNERGALEMLAKVCKKRLISYPQTMDENIATRDSGAAAAFSNRRTALLVVLGEQEILTFWSGVSDTVGHLLAKCSNDEEVQMTTPRDAIEAFDARKALENDLKSLPRNNPAEKDMARYARSIAVAHSRRGSNHHRTTFSRE